MKRPLIWFSAAFAVGVGLMLGGIAVSAWIAVPLLALSALAGWRFAKIRPLCVLLAGV